MPTPKYLEVTQKRRELFLEALKHTCSVTKAANVAKVARNTFYKLRAKDPDFAEAWEKALQIGIEALEDELMRRAKEGVLKPVFHKGAVCGHIREYSDTLGIFLLKGGKPEKYKDRVEQDQKSSIDVTVNVKYESPRATPEEEAD